MSVGSRIKELRLHKGLTRKELADAIGVSVAAISNYENEISSPKEPILFNIIECFECDANYIFQDVIKMKSTANKPPQLDTPVCHNICNELDDEGQEKLIERAEELIGLGYKRKGKPKQLREEPIYRMREIKYYHGSVSAGTGQIVFDTPPSKTIEIPDTHENRKANYALSVSGDSMQPLYNDGDTILVEITQTIDQGEIGVFIIDDTSYVKKLGKKTLISINKDYKDIKLTEDARCMGRVVGVLNVDSHKF